MSANTITAVRLDRDDDVHVPDWSATQYVCIECAKALGGDDTPAPIATRRALTQASRDLEAWYLGFHPQGESYREFSNHPCDLCRSTSAGERFGAVIHFLLLRSGVRS